MNRKYIGSEISKEYFQISKKKLKEVGQQLKLID
jgi:DNA modification methylase